jgi:glycosyltransferase involved in cell wall biosynthesis
MNQSKEYDLTIVIACYNEELHLRESVREIEEVMRRTIHSYELIFIDDCSQDRTSQIIEQICQNKVNYQCYFHSQNVGRGGTVREGLLKAKGRYAGFLDIDLEVHARYIPEMLRALEQGADLATAHRYYDMSQVFELKEIIRNFLSYGYRLVVRRYLRLNLSDTETGYKFFNKASMEEIIKKTRDNYWFWDTEIMALSNYHSKKIKEIPCLFLRREEKKSTVKLLRDVWRYLKAIRKFKRDYHHGVYN